MRLLVVSNRLPLTVTEREGKLSYKQSVGGLVSGLSAYLDSMKSSHFTKSDYVWVGWPGVSISDNLKGQLKKEALERFRGYPVFLPEEAMDSFYHGFCNKTIWPLFHYFLSHAVFNETYWQEYVSVNQTFCDTLLEIIKPGDVVWVHDYHLMLLPRMLREKKPDLPIGFFLHIPFPGYEIFRMLPKKWGREILEGLLGSNLVGFHTYEYRKYFARCAFRMLGYEHQMGQITAGARIIRAETFPMGIDFKKFHAAASKEKVEKEKERLKKPFENKKIIVSVDRLDYTKGVLNRLQGFSRFLEKYPEWHKKVVLIMVVVPSRIGVEHYQTMKRQIDEQVGRVNGTYGSIEWTPALYQNRFFAFHALVALYGMSDVALITPLRDGMNLIAKEYIATRVDETGVLILSEMAGAAKEMGEAVLVNPNSPDEIADAIKEALEMPEEEQKRRNHILQERLRHYDVVQWADDFIRQLMVMDLEQQKSNSRHLVSGVGKTVVGDYRQAKKRLILTDYDGTLVSFADHPRKASPPKKTLQILEDLCKDSANEVVIISGRDRDTLSEWMGHLPVNIVAEHGAFIKKKGGDWEELRRATDEWKPRIQPILKMYVDRIPGSMIEEKRYSLAWHYRRVDPELGASKAKELIDDLVTFTASIDVQVLQGNKVVEVRNIGIDKGSAGLRFLDDANYDFVLALGDDWTDEDLFKALPSSSVTVKVGTVHSAARYYVNGPSDVLDFLKELTA